MTITTDIRYRGPRPTMMTTERAGMFMARKGIRGLNELLRRYNIVIWGVSTVTYRDLNSLAREPHSRKFRGRP